MHEDYRIHLREVEQRIDKNRRIHGAKQLYRQQLWM
jgi:hypothetical protein